MELKASRVRQEAFEKEMKVAEEAAAIRIAQIRQIQEDVSKDYEAQRQKNVQEEALKRAAEEKAREEAEKQKKVHEKALKRAAAKKAQEEAEEQRKAQEEALKRAAEEKAYQEAEKKMKAREDFLKKKAREQAILEAEQLRERYEATRKELDDEEAALKKADERLAQGSQEVAKPVEGSKLDERGHHGVRRQAPFIEHSNHKHDCNREAFKCFPKHHAAAGAELRLYHLARW